MRSIRLRRRLDRAAASPGSDSEPTDGSARTEVDIPRALLPTDHRHRVERPALSRRLRSATHPRFYAAQVGEAALTDDVEAAIAHFVACGLGDGARISGLFNADIYEQRLADRGLKIEPGVHPFLHWL